MSAVAATAGPIGLLLDGPAISRFGHFGFAILENLMRLFYRRLGTLRYALFGLPFDRAFRRHAVMMPDDFVNMIMMSR
jgi:hypothetical protein